MAVASVAVRYLFSGALDDIVLGSDRGGLRSGSRRVRTFNGIRGYVVKGNPQQIAKFKKSQSNIAREIARIHRSNLRLFISQSTINRKDKLSRPPKVDVIVNENGEVRISESFTLNTYNSGTGQGRFAYIVNQTRLFEKARANTVLKAKTLLEDGELVFTPLG